MGFICLPALRMTESNSSQIEGLPGPAISIGGDVHGN
jgi:hypothetical protein